MKNFENKFIDTSFSSTVITSTCSGGIVRRELMKVSESIVADEI